MEAVNFDAYGDESALPQADVVGISGVSVGVDEEMCEITLAIGLSTREDTNLFRLNRYIAEMFEELLPTEHIPLYNADSGIQTGQMIVSNGTRTLTVGGSSTRPLQFIMVTLMSLVTFG